MDDRIIGRYQGRPGPLLICLGGIHGNELAGIQAIREVLRLLSAEQAQHPSFTLNGTFLGIQGNLSAIRSKQRFITRDLNRMLLQAEIDQLRALPPRDLSPDESECLALVDLVEAEYAVQQPGRTLLLDLHTTTAFGGVFTIAAEDTTSLSIAKGLHVPVILGIADTLKGTTIDYFNRPDRNLVSIVFEAGQHGDPESVSRTISAIINCMLAIGLVTHDHVDTRHEGLLKSLAAGLPAVTRLSYHYRIATGEHFQMGEGYKNFDPVRKGQVLAVNDHGPIHAPSDGLILMPKYQPLGDDGFFIVQPEDR